MNNVTTTDQVFHPVEQAILSDWLGCERPVVARDIILEAGGDEGDNRLITLRQTCDGGTNEFTLANAVARLVLEGIQNRLPSSAISYGGSVVLTRDYTTKSPRKLDLLPRFLFQINWANSGPGISWPVAYYLAWLPVYDVFVVTESADSPETLGYCDRALGWFGVDTPVTEGAKRVIAGDWLHRYNEWWQEHWEHFLDAGLISSEDVWGWAAEVWEEEVDDESDVETILR
jgi:hypothetical protein